MIVIDGSNKPLGRLASEVATLLRRGYPVTVINVENVIISGTLRGVLPKFKRRYELRTLGNPIKQTPRWPRTVEGIFRKAVAGMINRKDRSKLLKRLKVFRGNVKVEGKKIGITVRVPSRYVYLKDIAKELGDKI